MRRLVVGLWLVPVAIWAQPIPVTSEDVAPVSASTAIMQNSAVGSGLAVTPTVVVNPDVPPAGHDQIDQVLATVSATISSTSALVTSVSTMVSPGLPGEMEASPSAMVSSTAVEMSATTFVQQPAAEAAHATVRVTGNVGSQDKVLQTLKAMGLAATYTRITVDGAELAVPNANADTLAAQLHAKGLTAELGSDGAVEVRF